MKHVHRFFVTRPLGSGDTTVLDSDDSFHVAKVLHISPGEEVELVDPEGRIFMGSITRIGEKVQALAEYEIVVADGFASLTVIQALTGGRKMDYIVEKLGELGVERLIPAFTEKAVVRGYRTPEDKVGRWRRIAKAAAAQSKRRSPMIIDNPVLLTEWVTGNAGLSNTLVLEKNARRLRESIKTVSSPQLLIIGPEAGFSEYELERLKDAGAVFASLGSQVLRMETAAVVAAALVLNSMGVLG